MKKYVIIILLQFNDIVYNFNVIFVILLNSYDSFVEKGVILF